MTATAQQRFNGLPGPGREAKPLPNGETVRDVAERIGITEVAVRHRLKSMDFEKAISLPRVNRGCIEVPRTRYGFGQGKLSITELRCLQMLADGYAPKEMVSPHFTLRAVQQMMFRMKRKIGAVTTAQMTALGVKKGLIK